jgi:benzodiazapine receptor
VKGINWGRLAISIIICEGAGLIGSVFTFSQIPTWYATLNQPSFNPPSWLFGPVWTTLYLLMGVALYLVWPFDSAQEKSAAASRNKRQAMVLFGIQLVLNSLWSIIFFGLHNISAALAEIVVLWIFILLTTVEFHKINRWAGWLLVPYLLWSSFATFLTYSYWILNR